MKEILIIEDNMGIRELYKRSLNRHGDFAFAEAADVKTAIKYLFSISFDYVICDFELAQGNGRDVYKWLKEERPDQIKRFMFVCGDTSHINDLGIPFISKMNPHLDNAMFEKIEATCG